MAPKLFKYTRSTTRTWIFSFTRKFTFAERVWQQHVVYLNRGVTGCRQDSLQQTQLIPKWLLWASESVFFPPTTAFSFTVTSNSRVWQHTQDIYVGAWQVVGKIPCSKPQKTHSTLWTSESIFSLSSSKFLLPFALKKLDSPKLTLNVQTMCSNVHWTAPENVRISPHSTRNILFTYGKTWK